MGAVHVSCASAPHSVLPCGCAEEPPTTEFRGKNIRTRIRKCGTHRRCPRRPRGQGWREYPCMLQRGGGKVVGRSSEWGSARIRVTSAEPGSAGGLTLLGRDSSDAKRNGGNAREVSRHFFPSVCFRYIREPLSAFGVRAGCAQDVEFAAETFSEFALRSTSFCVSRASHSKQATHLLAHQRECRRP